MKLLIFFMTGFLAFSANAIDPSIVTVVGGHWENFEICDFDFKSEGSTGELELSLCANEDTRIDEYSSKKEVFIIASEVLTHQQYEIMDLNRGLTLNPFNRHQARRLRVAKSLFEIKTTRFSEGEVRWRRDGIKFSYGRDAKTRIEIFY